MSFVAKCLILSLSIAALEAADKNNAKDAFHVEPVDAYAARQTNDKITIAVDPYDTADKARTAFGKVNPNEYGVLPVLLVIRNGGARAIDLNQMRIDYIAPDRQRIESTPGKDVRYLRAPDRPRGVGDEPSRLPVPIPRGKKKNPLDAWEIDGRAFAARMLPAGESAHGFVYFQTRQRSGSLVYLTGIREAGTRREILYFEIPLP